MIKKNYAIIVFIVLVFLGIGAAVKVKPHVNPFACVGCGDCVRICPVKGKAIQLHRGKAVIDVDMCIACRKCVFICSYGAVK